MTAYNETLTDSTVVNDFSQNYITTLNDTPAILFPKIALPADILDLTDIQALLHAAVYYADSLPLDDINVVVLFNGALQLTDSLTIAIETFTKLPKLLMGLDVISLTDYSINFKAYASLSDILPLVEKFSFYMTMAFAEETISLAIEDFSIFVFIFSLPLDSLHIADSGNLIFHVGALLKDVITFSEKIFFLGMFLFNELALDIMELYETLYINTATPNLYLNEEKMSVIDIPNNNHSLRINEEITGGIRSPLEMLITNFVTTGLNINEITSFKENVSLFSILSPFIEAFSMSATISFSSKLGLKDLTAFTDININFHSTFGLKDTTTFLDIISILSKIPLSESFSFIEYINFSNQIGLTDLGTLTDIAVNFFNFTVLTETASITEIINLFSKIAVTQESFGLTQIFNILSQIGLKDNPFSFTETIALSSLIGFIESASLIETTKHGVIVYMLDNIDLPESVFYRGFIIVEESFDIIQTTVTLKPLLVTTDSLTLTDIAIHLTWLESLSDNLNTSNTFFNYAVFIPLADSLSLIKETYSIEVMLLFKESISAAEVLTYYLQYLIPLTTLNLSEPAFDILVKMGLSDIIPAFTETYTIAVKSLLNDTLQLISSFKYYMTTVFTDNISATDRLFFSMFDFIKDSFSIADFTITYAVSVIYKDIITPSEVLTVFSRINMADTVVVSDIQIAFKDFELMNDIVTFIEILKFKPEIAVIDSISLTDKAVSYFLGIVRTLIDSIDVIEKFNYYITINKQDSLDISEIFKILTVLQPFSESVSLTDMTVKFTNILSFIELISIKESFSKDTAAMLSLDAFSMAELKLIFFYHYLFPLDSISLLSAAYLKPILLMKDTLSYIDEYFHLLHSITKNELMLIFETFSKKPIIPLADIFNIADITPRLFINVLYKEGITLSEIVYNAIRSLLSERMAFSDILHLLPKLSIVDDAALIETYFKKPSIIKTDSLPAIDFINKEVFVTVINAIPLLDIISFHAPFISLTLLDAVVSNDVPAVFQFVLRTAVERVIRQIGIPIANIADLKSIDTQRLQTAVIIPRKLDVNVAGFYDYVYEEYYDVILYADDRTTIDGWRNLLENNFLTTFKAQSFNIINARQVIVVEVHKQDDESYTMRNLYKAVYQLKITCLI